MDDALREPKLTQFEVHFLQDEITKIQGVNLCYPIYNHTFTPNTSLSQCPTFISTKHTSGP